MFSFFKRKLYKRSSGEVIFIGDSYRHYPDGTVEKLPPLTEEQKQKEIKRHLQENRRRKVFDKKATRLIMKFLKKDVADYKSIKIFCEGEGGYHCELGIFNNELDKFFK